MATFKELRAERERLIDEARALLDAATTEKRGMKASEQERYDDIEERLDTIDRELRALDAFDASRIPSQPGLSQAHRYASVSPLHDKGITFKRENQLMDEFRYDPNSHELRHAFNRYLLDGTPSLNREEFRALQGDIGTMGGFMIMPTEVSAEFIRAKQNLVIMRRIGKSMLMEHATTLRAPALDAEIADPTWTAEIRTGTEDSTMSFEGRDLSPHPIAKRIKVSETLLRIAPAAESVVRDSMAYKFGVTEENAFLNGTGANQPLGVFTPSAHGIDTDRDITSIAALTVKADDIVSMIGNQKAQYRSGPSVGFIMSRYWHTALLKLKDGEGRFLLMPSLVAGQPDRLMGYPVYVSEYAPSAATSGSYAIVFGDFSFYWIVDALRMRVQRLTELYAETNQVGFIGRQETDGMPVLSEAFTRLQLK